MLLEFNVYALQESSVLMDSIKAYEKKFEIHLPNEFIIVGTCDNFYKIIQLTDEGLSYLPAIPFDQLCLLVSKDDLIKISDMYGFISYQFDIPNEYLTVELIDTIKCLNS